MIHKYGSLFVSSLVILMYVSPMWAQVGYYFGQNKVLYKDFEWAVLRTEHFDVHYYPEEEQGRPR